MKHHFLDFFVQVFIPKPHPEGFTLNVHPENLSKFLWEVKPSSADAAKGEGFTLLELLVVMAILGILATGTMVAVNPLEQIRRAQDSNTKTTAVEYAKAVARYQTARGDYPWGIQAGCTQPNGALNLSSLASCTTALINDRELKSDFDSNSDLSRIYPNIDASSQAFGICFMPQSKSQQLSTEVQYNRDGTSNATKDCSVDSAVNGCYWCVR